MYYYEPNDRKPMKWAAILTALYAAGLACAFVFVSFDIDAITRSNDEILVEFVEPEPPVEQPEPPRPEVAESREHDVLSPENNEQQVGGRDEQTRTVNQRALFRQPKGGVDEPENAGNPRAVEGDSDSASGKGEGLNADGNVSLDKGLLGRGLVGSLPEPPHPGNNKSGKIVIRVTVDERGHVVNADYEPVGSTSSDDELIRAAQAAARKTRFTESRALVEGGTITYYFKLK